MKHLVMFDIDGTLTASYQFDKRCFVSALADVLKTDNIESDWSKYKHVSSTGIAMEAIEKHTGKKASEKDLREVESRVMFHLSKLLEECRDDFVEVPGAKRLLNELKKKEHISISLATGCWTKEALFKLVHSGFDISSIPLASSNDAIAREDIMSASLDKAKKVNGINDFKSVTYIGDGIWDLMSSQKLDYHFIGVGENLQEFKKAGVRYLYKNFLDINRFLQTLHELTNTNGMDR